MSHRPDTPAPAPAPAASAPAAPMPPAKPPRQGRWSRFNSNHDPRIKVGLTCLAIGFIVGALAFVFIKPSIPGIFASETHEDNRQILQAVTRQQNIELLKVRVQGIAEKDSQAKFMGYKVPGANRALYLQYAYGIQLGIDGSQVQIKRVGEDHYRLTIPAFKVPGHSNIDLKKAVEKNGAISLVAPPKLTPPKWPARSSARTPKRSTSPTTGTPSSSSRRRSTTASSTQSTRTQRSTTTSQSRRTQHPRASAVSRSAPRPRPRRPQPHPRR